MITIVLPVSRPHYLSRVFASLEFLNCDRSVTELLVYVDGDQNLYEKARKYTVNSKFLHKKCLFGSKGPANVSSIRRRRRRISEIHNELKVLVTTEYVLSIEDDTLIPATTIDRLLSIVQMSRNVGIATGVEVGRWGYQHLGLWSVDDIYDPKKITSEALKENVQEIDSCGLYCCMFRSEIYKKHNFTPFLDCMGPDFNFGLTLRQEGYRNYVDYRVNCIHLTQKEEIRVSTSDIIQITLDKDKDWALSKINITV